MESWKRSKGGPPVGVDERRCGNAPVVHRQPHVGEGDLHQLAAADALILKPDEHGSGVLVAYRQGLAL
jgi:hypothetical protein